MLFLFFTFIFSEPMSLLTFKLLAAAAILAIAIIGGVIPLFAARHESSRRFFSLGNAFAGGLFLGVGFIHLLPEGMEKLEGVVDYPLAALLAALGLGALLLIDRVIYGDHHADPSPDKMQTQQSIYPYVLLALLSIHSVIAGITLGLESHVIGSFAIMLGILSHKGSAAFALMVSIHEAGIRVKQQKNMLAIFAAMTPLGILIGLVAAFFLTENETITALIEGSFNALAAGTFIYVATIEIIDAELSTREVRVAKYVLSALAGDDDVPMPAKDHDRVAKFILIIAGIALMALLTQWHIH